MTKSVIMRVTVAPFGASGGLLTRDSHQVGDKSILLLLYFCFTFQKATFAFEILRGVCGNVNYLIGHVS